MNGPGEITRLLQEARKGNQTAASDLFEKLYGQLHSIAAAYMRKERSGNVLQATALVNEAYLRLFGGGEIGPENRNHFFRMAAMAMRRILIDQARNANAGKRGGGAQKITLKDWMSVAAEQQVDEIDLDRAIGRLRRLDPRQAEIIELRLYAGRSQDEIAAMLEISRRTVERDIVTASAWLRRELSEPFNEPGTVAEN